MSLMYSSPIDLKNILKQLRKGEFKSRLEIVGLDEMHHTAHQFANKLSTAVLVGALVIGASIGLLAPLPNMPHLLGMPLVSFVGYAIALVLGSILVLSMRRN